MIKINEDPHANGYTNVPAKGVTGFFPQGADLEPILTELQTAGVAANNIQVFTGTVGEEQLDPLGERHGYFTQFMKFVEKQLFDENILFQRAQDVLQNGGSVVLVHPEADDLDWRPFGDILKSHGGRDVTHWGQWVVETVV